jgi:RsiW-degrading membrane proteinase PrsW (M82 family)
MYMPSFDQLAYGFYPKEKSDKMLSMYGSWVLLSLLLISSIPVIIVFAWFRIAKYKFLTVRFLLTLLAGAAAFFPALILQNLLNFTIPAGGRLYFFYHVFVRIAFTEELSRFLILIAFFMISSRIEKDKKAAATGLVAGLGFAIIENAVYGASNTDVLLLRTVTAAPLHAACGSRVGTAAAMIRSNPVLSLMRLITAAIIHGTYNFMIVRQGIISMVAVLITATVFASTIMEIRMWNKQEENLLH